jgi:hypothetical protein
VRQRELRMPAKNAAKAEEAEDEKPTQSQPETERYLLQIDRQSKRSFKTPEAARTAALEIKSRFPTLQVSVYDTVLGSRTILDSSQSASKVAPQR